MLKGKGKKTSSVGNVVKLFKDYADFYNEILVHEGSIDTAKIIVRNTHLLNTNFRIRHAIEHLKFTLKSIINEADRKYLDNVLIKLQKSLLSYSPTEEKLEELAEQGRIELQKMSGKLSQKAVAELDYWHSKRLTVIGIRNIIKIAQKELPKESSIYAETESVDIRKLAKKSKFKKQHPHSTEGEVKENTEDSENDSEDTIKTEDGSTAILEDIVPINPAHDFTDKYAFISVPTYFLDTVFDKKTETMKKIKNRGVLIIRNDKCTFRIKDETSQWGKFLFDIPDMAPDARFSSEGKKAFLQGNVDYNPYDVFKSVAKSFEKYVDFGDIPGAIIANSLYSFLTYFSPLFESVPYLWLTGDMLVGKTRACTVHAHLDFNAMLTVSVTASNIYRRLKDTGATVIIDEAERIASPDDPNSGSVRDNLLTGYKKGVTIYRTEREGNKFRSVPYPTFGCKIVGGISSVPPTLVSRSYKFLMLPTQIEAIANAEVKEKDEIWGKLRDQLYVLMMNHFSEVGDTNSMILKNGKSNEHTFVDGFILKLKDRDWEKAQSLLTLATWISSYAPKEMGGELLYQLWEFLRYQSQIQQEATSDSSDPIIINVVEELFFERGNTIQLKQVAEEVAKADNVNTESEKFSIRRYSRRIKSRLEHLGLGFNFRRGTANFMVFETSEKKINSCKGRYFSVKTVDDNLRIDLQKIGNYVTAINNQILSGDEMEKAVKEQNFNPVIGDIIKKVSKQLSELYSIMARNGKVQSKDALNQDHFEEFGD